ncbi:hatching enzyme 1.2-like [Brevipalpus obovatus]|uniref:hatching enzyme 1.2-like n=1 Tax=Brevipalpus obovatus TaxID=246614 RepID=UPI003D9F8323
MKKREFQFIFIFILGLYISNVSLKGNGTETPQERESIPINCKNVSRYNNLQSTDLRVSKNFVINSECSDEIGEKGSPVESNLTHSPEIMFRGEVDPQKRFWPKGQVPFVISHEYTLAGQNAIFAAMRVFHTKTCVRFIAKRPSHRAFIKFEPEERCETAIGMQKGEQKVILGKLCFDSPGWTESILMHALGFHSDHFMPIRDKFVEILWKNIPKKSHRFYRKLTDREWATLQVYEYESLTHFPNRIFKGYKGPPFKSKGPKKHIFGGPRLTNMDAVKINMKYKCSCNSYTAYDFKKGKN